MRNPAVCDFEGRRQAFAPWHTQGRVLRALWAVHWGRLATAAGCRLLQNMCAWSGPFLLQQLLSHLQSGAAICKPPVTLKHVYFCRQIK